MVLFRKCISLVDLRYRVLLHIPNLQEPWTFLAFFFALILQYVVAILPRISLLTYQGSARAILLHFSESRRRNGLVHQRALLLIRQSQCWRKISVLGRTASSSKLSESLDLCFVNNLIDFEINRRLRFSATAKRCLNALQITIPHHGDAAKVFIQRRLLKMEILLYKCFGARPLHVQLRRSGHHQIFQRHLFSLI